MPDTHRFASLLRAWRREKRLSQDQLAIRAGINRSTLSRWERGKHFPSNTELAAVLAALQATPEQAQQAFGSLPVPRTQHLLQSPIRVPALIVESGRDVRAPVGGDLLRAMRRRQNKTQAEVARAVGVTRTTLARWETSETWPPSDFLHRLCWELKAHSQEVAALTVGRFSPLLAWSDINTDADGIPTDLEEFEEKMRYLRECSAPATNEALSDLHHLIHLAGLWSLYRAGESRAIIALASRYAEFGLYRMDRGRGTEAAEFAETVLRLLEHFPELLDPFPAHTRHNRVTATLILAEWDVYGDGFSIEQRRDLTLTPLFPDPVAHPEVATEFRFRRGIHRLRSLNDHDLTRSLQTWVLAHRARYYAGDNQAEVGTELATRAAQVLENEESDRYWEIRARQQLQARILIHSGHPAEALKLVSESALNEMVQKPTGSYPTERQLLREALQIRASALFHLGNRSEAQALLQRRYDTVADNFGKIW
ncbi:MAG: hypothetical protein OHK0029_25600 [Armatimonadaceae bacterium]